MNDDLVVFEYIKNKELVTQHCISSAEKLTKKCFLSLIDALKKDVGIKGDIVILNILKFDKE